MEKLSSNAEIHFIDTGNSDTILIIKDNKAALIDGGDNDDEALVSSYIKKIRYIWVRICICNTPTCRSYRWIR